MLQTSTRVYLIEHETKSLPLSNRQVELSYVNSDGSVRIGLGEQSILFQRFAFEVSEYLVSPGNLTNLTFDQKIRLLKSKEMPALAIDYLACANQPDVDALLLFGRAEAALLRLVRQEFRSQTILLNGRTDDSDDSFFYQKLHRLDGEGSLIEYEGGLILLDDQLEILWHITKIYNYKVLEWQNCVLTISDGDSERRIDTRTGHDS